MRNGGAENVEAEAAQHSDLLQYLGTPDLGVAERTELVCHLFATLRDAHSKGFVHGALSPYNISVQVGGAAPRVRVRGLEATTRPAAADGMQATQALPTLPLWRAPEQAEGGEALSSADVWSLALLTFLVFTGKSYWPEDHDGAPPSDMPLSSRRAAELGVSGALPSGFDGWFQRAMSVKPGSRYPSAGPALKGLMMLLDRRVGKRHQLWIPIYCEALSGGVAITHDASDTGLLVRSRSLAKPGTPLQLRFSVPPGGTQSFTVNARVVRASANDDDPEGLWRYQLALRFEGGVDGLSEHLDSLAKQSGIPSP